MARTRLAYFPFNDTNWLGSAGQAPLGVTNAISRDAWLTKGVQIDSASARVLRYRDVETNANANINLRNGSDFAEVGAVPGASFIDTNLTTNTTYTDRLRASSDPAKDSSYSTNITVTTPTNGAAIPLGNVVI